MRDEPPGILADMLKTGDEVHSSRKRYRRSVSRLRLHFAASHQALVRSRTIGSADGRTDHLADIYFLAKASADNSLQVPGFGMQRVMLTLDPEP